MCPHCRAFITNKDRVCPYCDEKVGPRAIDLHDPGSLLPGLIPAGMFLSALILTLNAGLYLLTVVASMKQGNSSALMGIDGRTLALFGGKIRAFILAGQWWRLVTAGCLHGGIFHILMNSYGLVLLGPQVESYYGTRRMMVIYFVSTVGGFFASTVWSAGLSVGASAGLFGLLGAMLAITLMHEGHMADTMRSSILTIIGINLVFGFINPVIDNAAHIGGLISGVLVGLAARRPRLIANHPLERLWQILCWICVGLTAWSFFRWYVWFASI